MNPLHQISLRALRAHWPSAAGVFLTMLLASALVVGAGTLMESGRRSGDPFSPAATMLPAMMASFGGVAVMIAVFVVSTAFAAALRDRRREFALLRAVGATSRQVRALISTEVVSISLGAIVAGGVAGFFGAKALIPTLRDSGIVEEGFSLVVSPWPLLASVALLLPASWLAGRLAAREMATLSPASAVGSSSVDVRTVGAGRLAAAGLCAVAGLAATTTPLFIPGTMGGATGAASALLFITAVALAGPALVLRAATWAAGSRVLPSRAATVLATANTRGYSRRVTAAVVPLGLLLSLGFIQTGMSSITSQVARQQLEDGLSADLVWQGPTDATADVRAVLGALPGVEAAAVSEVGVVQARIEPAEEDAAFMEGLSWEPASVRSLDLDAAGGLVDPGVTDGNLAALSEPGTVAVASDALFGTSTGVGDTVGVRYRDGSQDELTIVKHNYRPNGLGNMMVGPQGFEPVASAGAGALVLVDTVDGRADAVVAAAAEAGVALVPVEEHVDEVMRSAGGDNRLSDTLLLALLVFIGIAAGNSLLIGTRSRAREFQMLARIGATRRQLRAMLGIEAAMIAVAALAIGVLTALPGLLTASLALARGVAHVVDPVMFGGLAVAVVGIAFVGVAGARLKVQV